GRPGAGLTSRHDVIRAMPLGLMPARSRRSNSACTVVGRAAEAEEADLQRGGRKWFASLRVGLRGESLLAEQVRHEVESRTKETAPDSPVGDPPLGVAGPPPGG